MDWNAKADRKEQKSDYAKLQRTLECYLPTELDAVLIGRSLVRVQVGEPKNTKARKRKFAGFFIGIRGLSSKHEYL